MGMHAQGAAFNVSQLTTCNESRLSHYKLYHYHKFSLTAKHIGFRHLHNERITKGRRKVIKFYLP